MKLQVGVKVLIENSEGLYLFLKRSKFLASDIGDTWDIPGGRINDNENLEDALRREVMEEIHYNLVSEPQLIAAQDIFVSSKDLHVVRLTYISKEDISGIVLSEEHDDYVWRLLNDTKDLIIEPYLKEVLDTLIP